jgi:hypothetical protein
MSTALLDSQAGKFAVAIRSVVFMLAALTASVTHPAAGEARVVPIEELKSVYLSCDRAAISGGLDTAAIMQCAAVYEELKRRAFGGDFDKLLAWWKAQQPARSAGR